MGCAVFKPKTSDIHPSEVKINNNNSTTSVKAPVSEGDLAVKTVEKDNQLADSCTSPEMATEGGDNPEVTKSQLLPELKRTKIGHIVPQPIPSRDLGDGFMSVHEMYNSMNDGQRAPYLHYPSYMLILDVRDREDFNEGHVTTARHGTAVDTEYDCRLSGGKLDKFTMVVVYDQASTAKEVSPSLSTFVQRLKEANVDVLMLSGGYRAFSDTYPFLCNNLTIRSEQDRMRHFKSCPSLVLESALYQGNVKHSLDEGILKSLKITHVLNVSTECKNAFPKTFEYQQVKVEDESTEQLGPHLQRAADFIADAIKSGGRVFVHCVQGKSRSSTCTLAFLMSYQGWTLTDSHEYLKERRSIAAPNRGFLIQLSKFEETLFGKVLSSVDDIYY